MQKAQSKLHLNCIQEERKKSDTSEAVSEFPFPFHVDPASQESLKQLDEYFETRSYVQVFDQTKCHRIFIKSGLGPHEGEMFGRGTP
jgi:hypothetical protein